MCSAYYATKYFSSPDMLIFSEGKKFIDFPVHSMKQTPLPVPMKGVLADSFFFVFLEHFFHLAPYYSSSWLNADWLDTFLNLNSHKNLRPPRLPSIPILLTTLISLSASLAIAMIIFSLPGPPLLSHAILLPLRPQVRQTYTSHPVLE